MTEFTIGQLAAVAGCTVRTIRYYIAEKVLPNPSNEGRVAIFTDSHLKRLQLIQRLKVSFLPLAEIRRRLESLSDEEVELKLAETPEKSGAAAITVPAEAKSRPETVVRQTWERVVVQEDIEIHFRHPLPSGSKLKAERLLSYANSAGSQEMGQTRIEAENRSVPDHAHPCNFRLHRRFDRGWGELAFEYRWDSTTGVKAADGVGNPDLSRCFLFEITSYAGNTGEWEGGNYLPESPFLDWQFRDPTDGRTASVGMESFPADQGWAWDRHKLGGRLLTDEKRAIPHPIIAIQTYRFSCEICGITEIAPGSHSGPHAILRVFGPCASAAQLIPISRSGANASQLMPKHSRLSSHAWRYLCQKHGFSAWMDMDDEGFLQDSAGLDFGPWDAPTQIDSSEWLSIESN